jgi:hypothetical protein
MSKNETPMTRWYWRQVGGTLIEEFPVVERGPDCERRAVDAIIIVGGVNRIAHWREPHQLEGKDIIVVQTKAERLGMYLMGQVFFSARLVERFKPRSVLSVALVNQNDSVLGPLLEAHPGMKVVICPADIGTERAEPEQESCAL